ncbi:hypothetical protein CG002_01515 [Mesoplasma florum]|uniref:hypothetical protein n=1 Tax=Mesoplasma florum TaxID=2151 RepID=UPI000BE33B9C|nr:hypothetical protein [Mesoplasma florum]ATI73258.1 hypothetical protein CQZ69_01615 [Mesoplasma florum]AVN61660.1 hypothetical protein CG004_01615 [Mesoplasma florum]AVN65039.1 hypothetical protein CG002_01515 [Mesoplasma florum]
MSWIFIGTTIGLFGCFMTFYYLSYKLSERKKILISQWIITPITFIVCSSVTITLCFLVNVDIAVLVSAFLWGTGVGICSGCLNYKYKYKKIHKLRGEI